MAVVENGVAPIGLNDGIGRLGEVENHHAFRGVVGNGVNAVFIRFHFTPNRGCGAKEFADEFGLCGVGNVEKQHMSRAAEHGNFTTVDGHGPASAVLQVEVARRSGGKGIVVPMAKQRHVE